MEEDATRNETLKRRDVAIESLVSGGRELIQRLEGLAREEKDIVVALMAVSHFVGVYARSRARPNPKIVTDFYHNVGALSPEISRRLDLRSIVLACLDQSIAYATAMAKCLEDESKTEDECERENWPEAAAEIACVMKELEELKRAISEGIRVRFPPGPPPPI